MVDMLLTIVQLTRKVVKNKFIIRNSDAIKKKHYSKISRVVIDVRPFDIVSECGLS